MLHQSARLPYQLCYNICFVCCIAIIYGCSNAAPPPVTSPLADSMRTKSIAEPEPSPDAKTLPTPNLGTDTGTRRYKGTSQDSIKTAANPFYKGDNSDTGITKNPMDMGNGK